jgi:hypothetical protein
MGLQTAIVLGIGTFGLGLLVTIPWYFLEKKARYSDPYYHAGSCCGDCGHTWLASTSESGWQEALNRNGVIPLFRTIFPAQHLFLCLLEQVMSYLTQEEASLHIGENIPEGLCHFHVPPLDFPLD